MTNYRMWAYSMIAVGLINWDYQRHHPHVALHSLLVIIPGLKLLSLTFAAWGRTLLENPLIKWSWVVIGIAALLFAFIN